MRTLNYVTWEEDGAFVAQCLDVDVASEGDNQDEAISNLKEALELYFENATGPRAPSAAHPGPAGELSKT